MAMIFGLFRRNRQAALIEGLYDGAAAASRVPDLYRRLGVPDTLEGRFEAMVLHVVLVMRRLRALPEPAGDVSQEFVDVVFKRLDNSLREIGVGDMSIAKKMKALAGGFYGRADVYLRLVDAADREGLAAALARNVAGGGPPLFGLADYALASAANLDGQDLDALLASGPRFAAPADFAAQP